MGSEPVHILSLGAGVQSSTLALMAAAGEVTPMPTAAIFADTQAEPKAVYEWLSWLEKQLPFPVIRATKGNLTGRSLVLHTSKNGKSYQKHAPPMFTFEGNKNSGMLMRQCTGDFKIDVINREMRRIIGRQRSASVICWVGISSDESDRMKPSRKSWVQNIWPLVERRISREACLRWMKEHGFPKPPKSSCYFCPYHDDATWARMKRDNPMDFGKSVRYESAMQRLFAKVSGFRGRVFLHRSGIPLGEIDFDKPDNQTTFNFFRNECEGMCGV